MQLGESQIDSITGPSTCSILFPPKYSNLPIQLLFGDCHRSFNNPCDDDRKNSYHIYEDRFLEILDEVAKKYPTNFYTESAYGYFIELVKRNEDGYLFSRLVRKMKDCYTNRNEYQYESLCKTTYLRWEHVDARFFEKSIEGYSDQYLYKFLTRQIALCDEKEILIDWLDIFEEKFSFASDPNVTTSALALVHLWLNLIVQYSTAMPPKKPEYLMSTRARARLTFLRQTLLLFQSRSDILDAQREIESIIEEESGITSHFDQFVDEITAIYFSTINIDNSSVARQLSKYKVTKGANVEFVTTCLKIHTSDEIKKDKGALRALLDRSSVDMLKLIQRLLQLPPRLNKTKFYADVQEKALQNIDRFNSCCKALDFFFLKFFSCFLDIFFITRMLSTNQPILSIGYFGDAHTRKIVSFLQNKLDYTVAYKSPPLLPGVHADSQSRCVEMPDVDLDRKLKEFLTNQRKEKAILHIRNLNLERELRLRSLNEANPLVRMFVTLKDELPIPDYLTQEVNE